jgi:hypothetical protein
MKYLTFILPLLCLLGGIVDAQNSYQNKEFGIMENLTVCSLGAAILTLLGCIIKCFPKLSQPDRALVVLFLLGSIYFAGEEISWGQHYFGIQTPESYGKLNYQGEMNLHNLDGGIFKKLFDRGPRALVTAGIFCMGIVFPFIRERLPQWTRRYVPGKELVLTSVLAVFISVPDKIFKLTTGSKSAFDPGEAKELYIALFILLYSIHFTRMQKPQASPTTPFQKF